MKGAVIMLSIRLKAARKALKLTQSELAQKVKTTKGTISNYENGHSTPSNEMLIDLADALETTTDYLLGRSNIHTGNSSTPIVPDKVDDSEAYDSLSEINKLVKQYGIEQMGFFDIEKWKNLSPHDVKMIEEHFKMIVKLAEEREKEE